MALEISYIDPILVQIGPVAIRWYALAYLAGFLLGWKYCLWLVSRRPEGERPNAQDIDDFLIWAVFGVILGGRIGYALFYQFPIYAADPMEIFKIWNGGMSFHGGLLGVVAALLLFAWRRKMPLLRLSDLVCASAPIGLFFGRIANFINMELLGRPTNVPWGVIFPDGYNMVRHPSQIYEALLEGALLFLILYVLARKDVRPGIITGVFLAGYGVFRGFVEFFRQPDSQIGLLWDSITMGQVLCLPMIVAGVVVIAFTFRQKSATPALHAQ